ncbi:MAG: iron-sulfur cluster repair di-iron protein [Bacteroidetes bacterium]|nr:MAG: iron-sulfur cluster repair di-iron protein [Bacteroidota bacterium]
MTITKSKTVAEIVTENIKTAHVFKKYGIDFCCGGGISVEKACAKKGLDYSRLEKELSAVDKVVDKAYDYDKWDLNFLIDHIINVHHKYVEENIPLLLQYADKVAKVHGHHYVEVVKINSLLREVANELSAHMKKEEIMLFPFIKLLVNSKKEGTVSPPPPFGTVNNPIQMMEHEHETVGEIFKTISQLSNNYTPPEEACNTFRALYAKLEEFEKDLHQHIHLENNILFPKAIVLENQKDF